MKSISGQMEASITKSFVAASKLKRWLGRSDAPPMIRECKRIFDKAFDARFSGSTILEDAETSKRRPVETPSGLSCLISQHKVVLRANATHAGSVYSRSSIHLGNSLVVYWAGGRVVSDLYSVGSIKYIYDHLGSVKLAVQRQMEAPPGTVDPFRPYADFGARLYSTALQEELEEVQMTWIIGHYARWEISSNLCVVLPLLRVRFPSVP